MADNDLTFDGIALLVPYFCECTTHWMTRDVFRESTNPCSHSPKIRAEQAMQALQTKSGRIAIVSGVKDKVVGLQGPRRFTDTMKANVDEVQLRAHSKRNS